MNSIYDMPPHGDFARYVEELTRQAAVRLGVSDAIAAAAPGTPAADAAQDIRARLLKKLGDAQTPGSKTPVRSGRKPPATGAAPRSAPAPMPRPGPLGAGPSAEAFKPLLQLVKIGIGLWIVYTIAVAVFPKAAVAGWLVLLGFAAWAFVRVRRLPWSELTTTMQAGIEEAARNPQQRQ